MIGGPEIGDSDARWESRWNFLGNEKERRKQHLHIILTSALTDDAQHLQNHTASSEHAFCEFVEDNESVPVFTTLFKKRIDCRSGSQKKQFFIL